MEDQIRSFISDKAVRKKLQLTGDSPLDVVSLRGGIWNYNFRVSNQNRKVVIKVYSETKPEYMRNSSPELEWKSIAYLTKFGLAPKPLWFEERSKYFQRPVLAYEYIEGVVGPFTNLMIEKVAEKMSELHTIRPELRLNFISERNYCYQSLREEIERRIAWLSTVMPNDKNLARFIEIYSSFENREDSPYAAVLLHTDLNPGNIIQTQQGAGVCFIDWQFPVFGDSSYDVWSFASDSYQRWALPSGLTGIQKQLFFEAYARCTGDYAVLNRANDKRGLYGLLLGLHYLRRQYQVEQMKKREVQIEGQADQFYRLGNGVTNCLRELDSM